MYWDERSEKRQNLRIQQFIIPVNILYIVIFYIYLYIQYFIYRNYSYLFQCIYIIFRESYPSTLLKLRCILSKQLSREHFNLTTVLSL